MKKFAAILLSLAMTVSLAACGGAPSEPSGAPESSGQAAPGEAASSEAASGQDGAQATGEDYATPYPETVTVNIARMGVSGNNLPEGENFETNQWLKWCEERLNIKINFAYIGADQASYDTRINLMMTSGLPDVMFVNRQQYETLVESELLADMTDIIPQYSSPLIQEYLTSYGGKIQEYASVDGRLYGIPSTTIAGGQPILWVRKDWREKLSLPEPKTIEDVFTIAHAFVTQDPDGNGKDDTVGLLGQKEVCLNQGAFMFDAIFAAYDAFPQSYLKDEAGKVYYGSVQPEAKEALKVLAEQYKAGNIDPEMVSRDWNSNYGQLSSSKAGIYFYPWHGAWAACDTIKTDPNARWELFAAPENAEGKVVSVNPEPVGQYLVVSKDYQYPELVMKLLSVEYQGLRNLDDEANEIYKDLGVSWLNWPIPLELNWKDALVRGTTKTFAAYESKDTNGLSTGELNSYNDYCTYMEKQPEENMGSWANGFAHGVASAFTGNEKFAFIDQAYYGTTETMLMKKANLDKMENEAYLKIITGEKPLEEFDAFVTKWYAEGGQDILDEIQEAVG